MKKVTIISAVLMGVLMCMSCGDNSASREHETTMIVEEPNIDELMHEELVLYVDQRVKAVIARNDFQEGDVDDRAQIFQPVLDNLKNGGYIEEYKYYPESSHAQILIEYTGGGSVTVVLKDTPEDEN